MEQQAGALEVAQEVVAQARAAGGTPWRCRLPWNLRWLAAQPEFRRTYLDLCAYLDSR